MKLGNKIIFIIFLQIFVRPMDGLVTPKNLRVASLASVSLAPAGRSTTVTTEALTSIDWSQNLHSFRACLRLTNDVRKKDQTTGGTITFTATMISGQERGAADSETFMHPTISGEICHIFSVVDLSNAFAEITDATSAAIEVSATATDFVPAADPVELSITVDVIRYDVNIPEDHPVVFNRGISDNYGHSHEVICTFPNCKIAPSNLRLVSWNINIQTIRFLCTKRTRQTPRCVVSVDDDVRPETYSIHSIRCPSSPCPLASLTVYDASDSTLSQLDTPVAVRRCGLETKILSPEIDNPHWTENFFHRVPVCVTFNTEVKECDQGSMNIKFDLAVILGDATVVYMSDKTLQPITPNSQRYCVSIVAQHIDNHNGKDFRGTGIATHVTISNVQSATNTPVTATVSFKTETYTITEGQSTVSLNTGIFYHILICKIPMRKIVTNGFGNDVTVKRTFCTPQLRGPQPFCWNTIKDPTATDKLFVVVFIECQSNCPASVTIATMIEEVTPTSVEMGKPVKLSACPTRTKFTSLPSSHGFMEDGKMGSKMLCLTFSEELSVCPEPQQSGSWNLKMVLDGNEILLFEKVMTPRTNNEDCSVLHLLMADAVSTILESTAFAGSQVKSEITIGSFEGKQNPESTTFQISLRSVKYPSRIPSATTYPLRDTTVTNIHEVICTTPNSDVVFNGDASSYNPTRYLCTEDRTKFHSCKESNKPVTPGKYSITSLDCKGTTECPTTYTVVDKAPTVTAALGSAVTLNDCGYPTTFMTDVDSAPYWPDNILHSTLICITFNDVQQCEDGKAGSSKIVLSVKIPGKTVTITRTTDMTQDLSQCTIFEATDFARKLGGKDLTTATIGNEVRVTGLESRHGTFKVSKESQYYVVTAPSLSPLTINAKDKLIDVICTFPACHVTGFLKTKAFQVRKTMCTMKDKKTTRCEDQTNVEDPVTTENQYLMTSFKCFNGGCPESVTVEVKKPRKGSANTFHLLSVGCILAAALALAA